MSTHLTHVPDVRFHDGQAIPQVGLGVWQVPDPIAAEVVRTAIEAGYRHVDTAMIYDNERGVGEGIRASGVPREELFVTTKLWNSDQRDADTVRRALGTSLELLGLEQVDLYLIHWPAPIYGERYVEAWAGLVAAREAGLTRSIGVSNFHEQHLERAIDATGVVPVINQVELHPYFQQRELRAVHERLGIVTQSWSPLGRGGELLQDPVITSIAQELGVTPAQVVVRWHVEHGFVTIPKSQHAERIAQNLDVFGFTLGDERLARIDALDRGAAGRIGPNPETAQF